jgi:SMODS-associating 4TM effector domain
MTCRRHEVEPEEPLIRGLERVAVELHLTPGPAGWAGSGVSPGSTGTRELLKRHLPRSAYEAIDYKASAHPKWHLRFLFCGRRTMTSTPPGEPSMATISESQNTQANVRLQVAARAFYTKGKRLHAIGVAFNLALALLAPILLFVDPKAGALLGALAGIWLFATRLVVQPVSDQRRRDGVAAQGNKSSYDLRAEMTSCTIPTAQA